MGLDRTVQVLNAVIVGMMLFSISSCEESLPPRVDPPTVLLSSLEMIGTPLIVVRDSLPIGTQGAFEARVLNVYDEVLQDSARIRLTLEVTLPELSKFKVFAGSQGEQKATVRAGEESLVNSNLLWRGYLTVGVDTAVILRKLWNHRTDDGVPFWSLVNLHPGATNSGELFCQSDTLTLTVKGSVQVFNIVQPQVFPDMHIRIVYKVFGISC